MGANVQITVVTHPLIDHALTYLRARTSDAETFQRHARVAAQVLVLEVLRDLPLEDTTVDTPLERTVARRLALAVIFVPVLRSGLAMLDAVRDFLPGSKVGFVGLERDEDTAIAHHYYSKLPAQLGGSRIVVLDPMLATGGSALAALDLLTAHGANDLRLASLVAAPDGVRAINERYPDVRLWCCALDRGLDARKFIVPGLGDFGDRYYGTA
jgi:uracil phosphoribosyltransferase